MRIRWIAALAAIVLLSGCGGIKDIKQGSPADKPAAPAPAQPAPAQPATQPQPAPPQPASAQVTTLPNGKKQWSQPPAMQIDLNKQYFALMKTSFGDVRIELFTKDAPKTVNNFVFLARDGFYDGLTFHRIIKDFMIQGGDPKGDGTGSPGYRFADELPVKRSYEPGIVAMANSGRNTQGSQFFICNSPGCTNLDRTPNYTQFGKVVGGMDVILKISAVEVVAGGEASPSKPKVPPVIQKITIEEK